MTIPANPLLNPGPSPGLGSGPAAAAIPQILALNLVHVVGGLREIDAKMELLVGYAKEIEAGISYLDKDEKKGGGGGGGSDDDSNDVGQAAMIGGAIGGAFGSIAATIGMKFFGAVTGMITTITGSITKYLSPIAILSSAIQSQSSGYSTFGKTFQVLGASIGIILLPAFAVLGATVLTIADKIANNLLPNIEAFAEYMLTDGLEGIETFIDACTTLSHMFGELTDGIAIILSDFMDLGKFLASLADPALFVKMMSGDINGVAKSIIEKRDESFATTFQLVDQFKQNLNRHFGQERNRRQEREGGIAATYTDDQGNTVTDKTKNNDSLKTDILGNLNKFIAEQQRAIGGNSQSSSISDIGKQIQQSAFNASPFEQQMLKWAMEALQALNTVAAKITPPVTT